MKRLIRWCLILAGGCAALYLVALAIYSLQPDVNDASLRPTREEIPADQNAFATLEQAATQVWWPEESNAAIYELVKATNWDSAFAAKALANNQQALQLLDKAMQMPSLQVPEVQMLQELPYLSGWKRLSQVALIRANATWRAGRELEAFQQAMALVRLGRRMQESKGAVLHYLVGTAVKAQGLSWMRARAHSTRLTPQQLAGIVAELEAIPSGSTALAETLRVEYQMQVKGLADLRAGRLQPGGEVGRFVPIKLLPVYNHGKTKRLFANATQGLIESADLPYAKAKLPNFDTRPSPAKIILSGNLAGEVFYWMTMPATMVVIKKRCQESVDLQTTRLLLAMRAYQLKHQRLPDSLGALAPEFIAAVPEDAFNGEPLRYSADKKVIYSVGENLRDDDGQIVKEKSTSRQLDYGYAVEF
jgi:hypothetical protein